MNITINPKKITGQVNIVSSKSLSHRYVIAASLAYGQSEIKNVLDSEDLEATRSALKTLGIQFNMNTIDGGHLRCVEKTIDANESGSTLRFIIPIAMLLNEPITFIGRGRLDQRPLNVYEKLFKNKAIRFERQGSNWLPLIVEGPLKAGHYIVDGNVSSQFISGLLFALPKLEEDSVIELTSELESKGYVDLTLDVLDEFGVQIVNEGQFYYIKGNQKYIPRNVTVEGDFSQAAFFFVAGTIGKPIILHHLNPNSKQGDREIVEIIRRMGGNIEYIDNIKAYVVSPAKTFATTIDLKHIPDLGPVLMVLAALSEGRSRFINFERLRIKESDRLEAMIITLNQLGVKVEMNEDSVYITGKETLKGNQIFQTFGDHRIAMAIAVAAIRANGKITIEDAGVVKKSYPKFFDEYQSLGGEFDGNE
jgi:3-phosphoshikimate 1-carboxyvinyltransferase